MTADAIILDVLTSGEVWSGANRVASKSVYPELNAARSLRGVGIPLSTAITFQRLGRAVRHSTLAFILRSDEQKAVMP